MQGDVIGMLSAGVFLPLACVFLMQDLTYEIICQVLYCCQKRNSYKKQFDFSVGAIWFKDKGMERS